MERLLPGEYNEDNELINTWEELKDKAYIKTVSIMLTECNKNMHKLVLGDDIKHMKYDSFLKTTIDTLHISETISDFNYFSLDGCLLQNIEVDPNNPFYSSKNGVLYNKDGTELLKYPQGRSESEFIVDKNVTKIGTNAFHFAENLEKIILHNDITVFDGYAFIGCSKLTEMTIPFNIEQFGPNIFSNCDNLKTLKYYGTQSKFLKIKNWGEFLYQNNLKIDDIIFNYKPTLEELIDEKRSIQDVNKILKICEICK